jgi:hypothetical protein
MGDELFRGRARAIGAMHVPGGGLKVAFAAPTGAIQVGRLGLHSLAPAHPVRRSIWLRSSPRCCLPAPVTDVSS